MEEPPFVIIKQNNFISSWFVVLGSRNTAKKERATTPKVAQLDHFLRRNDFQEQERETFQRKLTNDPKSIEDRLMTNSPGDFN